MRNELPCLYGKDEIVGSFGAPLLKRFDLRRLIKGMLYFDRIEKRVIGLS
jgi:hypothetical protein